jgi:O-methyltransferase
MLAMADYVLAAPPGPLVECGCYAGASTAKLSVLAAMTGRKLYVCDSFQGLPETSDRERSWSTMQGLVNGFQRGQYAVGLADVQRNVQRFGDASVCEWVPGFFCDSLPGLDVSPAFVFSDADLISSTRDTLKHLWPRIVAGGRWYTHDANICDLVRGIMDPQWWLQEIGEYPPILWGAGYGVGFQAGGIAYAEKTAADTRVAQTESVINEALAR